MLVSHQRSSFSSAILSNHRVEFVIAHIQRRVDRYEGLEINIDLAFLITVFGKDCAAIDDKTVRRAFDVVQFETLLRAGNGGQRGQSIVDAIGFY